jgi:serine/threonine protein kinase
MMAKRISVGEPINQAEERVFKYLEAKLPDDYIIYTNLSITQNGLDYDFDAIVLGRHAIYVVEIKNIGGSIRGNNFRWEVVGKDGALFTLPKNPLEQANLQRRILAGRLKHRDRKFGKIFVQDCVCLAGEEEPRFEIKDNPKRLNKVLWYKGIEKFLTDPEKLMYPPEWNLITDDITPYHADISKAIEEGFKSTPAIPRRIREFQIEGEAWVSSRYRAYLASRKTKYPYKCLLKIYPVPSEIQDKERWDFIRQLERELNAIRVIRDAGDPTIGGQKNVAIGYEAFPLSRSNEYAVVMEWVDGLPLSKELNTKKITLRQKYQIAAQTCRGLAFAHTAGVVHRNLSLDNVIYNPHSGLVKIVNFDFAKFIAGSPVGTIRLAEEEAPTDTDIDIWKQYIADMAQQRKYVAPEIRPKQGMPRYHDASPETDLYALGVMLFELFSEKVLASEAAPDINFLNAIDDLDPSIAKWLILLSSDKDERNQVSLLDIADELTSLAQDYPQDIRLPELKLGSTFNKKYEISSLLSSTEMSVVYRARDNSLDQEVVLKLLRATSEDALGEIQRTYKIWRDIDPKYTARWLDGGSVFARGDIIEESSQDPNAVRIYYLVMEFLEGRSLRELLNEGQLDFENTFDIAVKVIRAVAAIHQAEQIHRDIKPDNLIQTLEGHVKIIDFGLSQRFDEVVEVTGVSLGYSPPEIFPGPDGNTQPWTYAGDVYSTACVLAALFCGEEHGQQPVLDPQLLKDAAGQALSDLILYNLNGDPGKRNTSAVEILRDIEKIDTLADTDNKRSPSMATKYNYQDVVTKIREMADEEQDLLVNLERAESLRRKANQLEDWIMDDQNGECPLDISQYGFDVEPKKSISELKDSPPAPEPESVPETKKDAKSVKEVEAEPESEAAVDVFINETVADEKDDQVVEVETTEQQETQVVSPEQAVIREQLAQARKYLQDGELRQAVALARIIELRAGSGERDEIDSLLAEALPKFNAALDGYIEKGDESRISGDEESAISNYQMARDLDPDNMHVRDGLRLLDNVKTDALIKEISSEEINRLRGGLKERKNIKRLGKAVYDAEALDAEDRLPDGFGPLLQVARDHYDKSRQLHGELATMSVFADLAGKKEAFDKINALFASREKFIFDPVTNEEVPIAKMLEKVSISLQNSSKETAQYEIGVINRFLPAYPIGARKRLEDALGKPFAEEQKIILEEKLDEVNLLIERQNTAKKYLLDADKETDSVQALALVLRAWGAFEYLPGLDVQINQSRAQALSGLMQQMSDTHKRIIPLIKTNDFSQARDLISQSESLVATWPEDETPKELQKLVEKGDKFRQKVDEAEKNLQEFVSWAGQIREDVGDEHRREQAIEQFEKLRLEERFADLIEMRHLASEMDQYRDVAAKLTEADQARRRKDWQRVYELAVNIRGKAGEYGAQVDKLYLEAEQELKIEEGLHLLGNLDVAGANSIFSSLMQNITPERKQEFEKRLVNENKIIDQAIKENPEMQKLLDRASTLQKKNIAKKLEALRLFRFIGGINIDPPNKDWPEYKLSLRTAGARKLAGELTEKMRNKYLPSLQKAYEQRSKKTLDAEGLRKLNVMAEALREGHLLNSEDERAYIRWVEVEWGKEQAEAKESTQDWRTAVQIWRKLDLNHPGTLDVESGLRGALIHNAVMEADRLMYNEHQEREAISVLHAVQKERGLNTSWEILLKISEAYSRIGEFEHALGTLGEAERYGAHKSTTKSKKADIEREKIIQTALLNAENKLSIGSPREAFIVLSDVLSKPTVNKSQRLRERRDQLFQSEQGKLLKIAQEARSSALDGDKVRAVTALVDLRELEDLMELPQNKRRSGKELSKMKGDLSEVAETLLGNVHNFDTTSISLGRSLREGEKLVGRLQTFLEVIPLFEKEMGEFKERLEMRRRNLSKETQKLKRLNIMLEDAKQSSHWEQALRLNDFDLLNEKYQLMQAAGLTRIPDFYRFERRLQEWQRIHTYILEQIEELNRLFNGDEDFDNSIVLLRRLTSRPDTGSGGTTWQQLEHSDYEQILKIMNGHFRIVNIYGDGDDLVGPDDIEAEAIQRHQQLETWIGWDKECQRKMEMAENALRLVEKYKPGGDAVPYRHQERDWGIVEEKAVQVVKLLKSEPQEDGNVLPIRSYKAKEIQKEGLRRLEIAEEWYHAAMQALTVINEILKVKGLPSEEELNNTASQKDWVRLERLLTQAEQAGLVDDVEERRIAVFKLVLRNAKEQNKKSIWNLFKRKG